MCVYILNYMLENIGLKSSPSVPTANFLVQGPIFHWSCLFLYILHPEAGVASPRPSCSSPPWWSSEAPSIRFKLHSMACVGLHDWALTLLPSHRAFLRLPLCVCSLCSQSLSWPLYTLSWLTLTYLSGLRVNTSYSCLSFLTPAVWGTYSHTVLSQHPIIKCLFIHFCAPFDGKPK